MIEKLVTRLSGPVAEGIALLFTRIALAGIFWRSARTKVEDGSFLTIKDTTFFQFSDAPFNQVPILNGDLGAYVTTYLEHFLPLLLLLGLATRLGALGILGMTLVIQIFVFPEMAVWWQTHILWVAMALVLIVRGGGLFSLDRLVGQRLG
ncbi:DoxX family membrane protein [Parasphingorhabdus sp.]|uniref:DoxX family membrane protein n=1 Tax=Parasphingorhabdus sp. TaxID=2709688 RepID=UPI003593CB8A